MSKNQNIELLNSMTGFEILKKHNLDDEVIGFKSGDNVYDLHASVPVGSVQILYKTDDEYIHFLRHDAAHVLAHGLINLFPNIEFGKQFFKDMYIFGFDVYLPEHKFVKSDFSEIEDAMKKVVAQKDKLIRHIWSKEKALDYFNGDQFKQDIINDKPGDIMLYEHGDYIDICGGPRGSNNDHVSDNFVLLDIENVEWQYDKNKKMQRIIGACFRSKDEMNKFLMEYK